MKKTVKFEKKLFALRLKSKHESLSLCIALCRVLYSHVYTMKIITGVSTC